MSIKTTVGQMNPDDEPCIECDRWIPGPHDQDEIARGAICDACMKAIKRFCHLPKENPSPACSLDTEKFHLHGFSFETAEKRQSVAEGHHLWGGFLKWFQRRYEGYPDLGDEHTRELYEFFIEGGRCEMDHATPVP